MIELKKVYKEYQMGSEAVAALDRIDLTIKDGEFVAVVGPSGSGKSTLVNMIGALDRPNGGKILIDEINLDGRSDGELSRYRNQTIGFVFQSFYLLPQLTVLENVMLPLLFSKVKAKLRAQSALECVEAVGLKDRMHFYPNQLSGGQRQRVSIARALVNKPKIIIADEPTGNLDSKKSAEIILLLKSIRKKTGITLIIITHDLSIAKQADRVLSIQDGKLKTR